MDASKQCDDFPDCDYGEDERDCQYDEEPIDEKEDDENNDVEEEVNGIATMFLSIMRPLGKLFRIKKIWIVLINSYFSIVSEQDQPSNDELQCDELDEFKCADGTECILKGDDTLSIQS